MRRFFTYFFILFAIGINPLAASPEEGLPLYHWNEEPSFVNFGDYLSVKIVERIVHGNLRVCPKAFSKTEKKLLALGSILSFARNNDVLWGTGMNGKAHCKYLFNALDVRAVRGPMTRDFLMKNFHISVPEVYGDPALLFPYLYPEFKKKKNPKYNYVVIIHYSETKMFPKTLGAEIVHSTDPWNEVVEKILDSQFVISSSLHGVVLAEAYGIPARLLRVTSGEPLFKYQDYYQGTGRETFEFAASIKEALQMGGEAPGVYQVEALWNAFPFEFWPSLTFYKPNFSHLP